MRLDDGFSEELMLDYAQSASAGQLERIVSGCRTVVSVEQGTERQFAERELSAFATPAARSLVALSAITSTVTT